MRRYALAVVVAGILTSAANADMPPSPAGGVPEPYRQLVLRGGSLFGRREFLEMLLAFGEGGRMGPGAGWFHTSESRYGWPWLATRHGIGLRDDIAKAKFLGPVELFDRLDRDGNGVLNADDFDWSMKSAFVRRVNLLEELGRAMDGNSNGRISPKEWEAFFARAAGEKGYATADDLRAALAAPRPSGPPPSPAIMLRGLFNGELGSSSEGPDVNQLAPDFALPTHDGKREVRLSDVRGKKPVVIVFGSFT